MSAGSSIDWGANVPVYDPDGQLHAIPQGAQAKLALQQPGAKLAVPMIDPQGTHHWVNQDDVKDAVANGGRVSFPSQEIPKWFGFTPSNVASNVWSGAKGIVSGTGALLKDLVSNPNWFNGANSTYEKFIGQPAEQQVVQAGQALNQPGIGSKVQAAGHALASAVPFAGPWAAGVGQQAGTGDVGGAAGQIAGGIASGKIMEATAKGGASALNRVIPSTTRAAAGISALESQHATQPITPVLASNAATDISNRLQQTGEVPHPLIQTFQDRMTTADLASRHPEIAQGLADRGIPTNNPLTFPEARAFLKRANEIKYESGAGQNVKNQMSQFAGALDQDIQAGAQQGGFGDLYNQFTNEYGTGKGIIRGADQIGPYVGAGVGYEVGRRMGEPIGGTIIGGMAGKAIAKPVIGGLTRSIIERDAGPPQLTQPPSLPYRAGAAVGNYLGPAPPAPSPAPPSPSQYTRILLDAKEGKITPGYADTLIKRAGGSTKVNQIEPPNVASTQPQQISPAPPPQVSATSPSQSVNTPLPTTSSPTLPSAEPPLPPNTVHINVQGEDRFVKLTDDQMQQWNEAQARFQSKQDSVRQSFVNDPQEMQARLKRIGMQYAAEKRAIAGQLTGTEAAAVRTREATNYVGKAVSVNGQNATIMGTTFGRIKVKLANGNVITVLPEHVTTPLPPPLQQQ